MVCDDVNDWSEIQSQFTGGAASERVGTNTVGGVGDPLQAEAFCSLHREGEGELMRLSFDVRS